MGSFKCIIAGSRDFDDYGFLGRELDKVFSKRKPTEIVSGGCRGTDCLAVRYALERKIPFKVIPAEWDKYGRSAGPLRNIKMAEYGDALVAFWDGKSRGTKSMIEIARGMGLDNRIVRYIRITE